MALFFPTSPHYVPFFGLLEPQDEEKEPFWWVFMIKNGEEE